VGHKFEREQEEILSSLLDPRTKMLSFCDNKYFPSWKDDALGYLSMDLKSFYVQATQGEVKDSEGQVNHRSDRGLCQKEAQLQVYMQVQQVSNDTDPLMWWKKHQQELPEWLDSTTSTSPERFFSRVGFVQTDLRGRLLDTMWAKQEP
jgi:hypothetical protein